MSVWYVVQVFRHKEEKITQEAQLDSRFKVFYPKRYRIKSSKQNSNLQLVPLFPGYIFIETNESAYAFQQFYHKVLQPLEGVVKVLKHKEETEALWPEEKAFISALINKENVVETSIGLKVDDKVIITDGPLVGKESQIVKIDRHKRLAYLQFELFGQEQTFEISLEVLTKQI